MRYFIAGAMLYLASINAAFAQFVISGHVKTVTGSSLPGCHIHAGSSYLNTDGNGYFSLTLPKGKHTISASFVGYRTATKTIDVSADQTVDFVMEADVSVLADVIVSSGARHATAQPKQTLRTRELEKFSNASLGDLVREISGVSSLKTGSTVVKPVINGLHSSRVLVINNNVRLEDQQWGLEHAPNLDVNSAGSVSVIKGAGGLQYGGDAIGGVILVDPPKIPIKDTLYGRAIVNSATNGRGGSASASLYKGYASGWNWTAQGTFKYLGDLESPDYVLSNTGIREKNGSFGLGKRGAHEGFGFFYSYYSAEIGILRASHIGNITDLVNAINSGQPDIVKSFTYNIDAPKQTVQHHLAKLNYYHDWHLGRLDVQYSFQFNNRLEYDIRRGENADRPALDLDLATHAVLVDFGTDKTKKIRLKAGLTGTYQNNAANFATGVRPLIPDYNKIDVGGYLTAAQDISEKWQLEAGIRYDFSHVDAVKYYLKSRWESQGYSEDFGNIITGDFGTQWKTNPVFVYHNISAALGSMFRVTDDLDWFVNAALTRRNPNPSELFSDGLHHSNGQIELGDLRLQQETSLKISTTLSYVKKGFYLELNPHLNRVADFMYLQPTGIEYTIRGAFPVWEYRQADAQLYGADVTANCELTEALSYHTTFSYVNGKNLDTNEPLIDMPPARWGNEVRFKSKKWHDLSLGLRNEWALFQNRYPDNDFYADVLVEGVPTLTLVRISRPPASYNLMHFSAQMSFNTFPKVKTTIVFGVENILNTSYRDYPNRMRYYADDLGRNFTFQIKFNF